MPLDLQWSADIVGGFFAVIGTRGCIHPPLLVCSEAVLVCEVPRFTPTDWRDVTMTSDARPQDDLCVVAPGPQHNTNRPFIKAVRIHNLRISILCDHPQPLCDPVTPRPGLRTLPRLREKHSENFESGVQLKLKPQNVTETLVDIRSWEGTQQAEYTTHHNIAF